MRRPFLLAGVFQQRQPHDLIGIHGPGIQILIGRIQHGGRHIVSRDRPVLAQGANQQRRNQPASKNAGFFSRPVFPSLSEEYRRPHEHHLRQTERCDIAFGLAFDPVVEDPRFRVGTQSRHHQKLLRTRTPAKTRKCQRKIVIHACESLPRPRFPDGGAKTTENIVAMLTDRFECFEVHQIDAKLRMRKRKRTTGKHGDLVIRRMIEQSDETSFADETTGAGKYGVLSHGLQPAYWAAR